MTTTFEEDDEEDEYGYPVLKHLEDDDEIGTLKGLGRVGLKWRVCVVRVRDSEEQWKGVCEIYFHWECGDSSVDKSVRKRGSNNMTEKERLAIVNIPPPNRVPNFIILNEEESNSIEEMYYSLAGFPGICFGYLAWTVAVYERLELERYPFDRQFFKLEIECTNGLLTPWTFQHIPSIVHERIEIGDKRCNYFAVSNSPSWQLDKLSVSKGKRDSVITMHIGLSRLSGFYISNVGLPCFLIGIAASLTTAIEPSDYADRFQCMIALYLTLVAIKFVASFLPVISYSTLLDYYALIAYFFLASWMVENFMVSPLFFGESEQDEAKRIDRRCACVYVALWLSLHLLVVLGAYFDLFRKSWFEVENDDEEVDPDTHKEVFDVDPEK